MVQQYDMGLGILVFFVVGVVFGVVGLVWWFFNEVDRCRCYGVKKLMLYVLCLQDGFEVLDSVGNGYFEECVEKFNVEIVCVCVQFEGFGSEG